MQYFDLPPAMPQVPPDSIGYLWTKVDASYKNNPVLAGLIEPSWTPLDFNLVEAAGVEPASASTLPLALHA